MNCKAITKHLKCQNGAEQPGREIMTTHEKNWEKLLPFLRPHSDPNSGKFAVSCFTFPQQQWQNFSSHFLVQTCQNTRYVCQQKYQL